MHDPLSLARLLGPTGPSTVAAMEAARCFLEANDPTQLLARVGSTVEQVAPFEAVDKRPLPASYGGGGTGRTDDFLAGQGLFYITEGRRLFLDCTAGHYQMTWGYQHPALCRAVDEAVRAGVVWDNHTNIPQAPLKELAHRLVAAANGAGDPDPLDTVLLGVCTGSVACGAALKTMLRVHQRDHGTTGPPALVVLDGNYHGTDMVAQYMRGMWPEFVHNLDVVAVEPNDVEQLEETFRQLDGRVAGFWAEPVMMNREAIAVEAGYLRAVREQCDRVGALLCVDEIQTGFWQREVFAFRELGLRPHLVVLGKGMTAGFHPLAGVLMHRRNDLLAQYDAISTNGSAALPSVVALASMELIARDADRVHRTARHIERSFAALVAEFPETLQSANGRGHLAGLKFRTVDAAKECHRRLLERGLWARVHAYHEGHRTVLTKLGLLADEGVVDFMADQFRAVLRG